MSEVLIRRAKRSELGAVARMAAANWSELLDACGKLNDVCVLRVARRRGIARRLIEAMLLELEGLGAPRVVLSSAGGNRAAQQLFSSIGFRRTMIEMTRELPRGA